MKRGETAYNPIDIKGGSTKPGIPTKSIRRSKGYGVIFAFDIIMETRMM